MIETASINKVSAFFHRYSPLKYKKRVMILHANDFPSSVFFIKSGFLRVFRISEQGEELTLNILKPYDFFPLTYGMNQNISPYYLETMTPLELWKAPAETFVQYIRSDPELYQELTTQILIRFDSLMTRMEYLVFSNARTKIAATLLVCAKRYGQVMEDNSLLITVPLTHKDIATLIGITRETTSLEMKKFEINGYIKRQGKLLRLVKLAELQEETKIPALENASTISWL